MSCFNFPSPPAANQVVFNTDNHQHYRYNAAIGAWETIQIELDPIYVNTEGDTITGPIEITDPSLIQQDNHLVNKRYVDDRVNNSLGQLTASHYIFKPPGQAKLIGSVNLTIPADMEQITSYTLEAAITGDAEDEQYSWTIIKKAGGTDVTADVLATNTGKTVQASFIDDVEHTITCTVTSAEAIDSPKSASVDVSIAFNDGLPKIGQVTLNTPANHSEGATEAYSASISGDASDPVYGFSVDEIESTVVGVFDHERVLDTLEKACIDYMGDNHPNTPLLLEAMEYAMTRIEKLIRWPKDIYWQHRWCSINHESLDTNINVPWDGREWKGKFASEIREKPTNGATCGQSAGNDLVLKPNAGAWKSPMAFAAFSMSIGFWKIKDEVPTPSWWLDGWKDLLTHELLHGMGIIFIDQGWYRIPDQSVMDLWINENYLEETYHPKTIAAYRQITGDNSFTMMPMIGTDALYPGDAGHPSMYAHTRDGKVYPGYESVIAIDENHYNRKDITIIEVSLLADKGWEEITPGASENDSPNVHYGSIVGGESLATRAVEPLSCSHESHVGTRYLKALPANRATDIPALLGYDPSSLDQASGFGSLVLDWSPKVISASGNAAQIQLKHAGDYDVTATVTSSEANDGPKRGSKTVTVLSDIVYEAYQIAAAAGDVYLPPENGTFYMLDGFNVVTSRFGDAAEFRFADLDADSVLHTWDVVENGKQLSIVDYENDSDDVNDFYLGTISDFSEDDTDHHIDITATAEKSLGGVLTGDRVNVHVYEVPEIADPSAYLPLIGGTLTGNLFTDTGNVSIKSKVSASSSNNSFYVANSSNQGCFKVQGNGHVEALKAGFTAKGSIISGGGLKATGTVTGPGVKGPYKMYVGNATYASMYIRESTHNVFCRNYIYCNSYNDSSSNGDRVALGEVKFTKSADGNLYWE